MKLISVLFLLVYLCALPINAKNTALLIGIGHYDTKSTGWPVIHGDNDIALLAPKLKKQGFNITTLSDSIATKKNILSFVQSLINQTTYGDSVYIHFSGHGQLVEDLNNDEQGVYDQSFICYDACISTRYIVANHTYKGQCHLIDDELFPYLERLKLRVGNNGFVMVIFDACYSAGADRGNILEDSNSDSEIEWINTTRGTSDEFQLNKTAKDYLRNIQMPGNYTFEGGVVTIISACESDQRNYECRDRYSGRCYGSLSYCISKLLDNHINMSKWYDYFINKKYSSLHIFRPTQHPTVERHD